MASQFNSKHGIVRKNPAELYMAFTDMRLFKQMIPADKQIDVEADYDSLTATVQGFKICVKVVQRVPYSLVELATDESPFQFSIKFCFDNAEGGRTDFHIDVDAELNMMMKMMLGNKIKEGLDQIVDQLANV